MALPAGAKAKIADPREAALISFFRALRIPRSDLDHPGLDLHNTPRRVAKMFSEELLASYKPGAYEDLVRRFTAFNSDGRDAMVAEGPIQFTSLCSHHAATFSGEAYVAYIPGKKLVGASKLARTVEFYARMFQIQERMSRQIAEFIGVHAEASAVLVLLRATHECMRCRGVLQRSSKLLTTSVWPEEIVYERRDIIDEFYKQIDLLQG